MAKQTKAPEGANTMQMKNPDPMMVAVDISADHVATAAKLRGHATAMLALAEKLHPSRAPYTNGRTETEDAPVTRSTKPSKADADAKFEDTETEEEQEEESPDANAEEEEEQPDPEQEEEKEPTEDDVRKAYAAYTARMKTRPGVSQEAARAKGVAILKKNFKVDMISKLKPTQYKAAIQAVNG